MPCLRFINQTIKEKSIFVHTARYYLLWSITVVAYSYFLQFLGLAHVICKFLALQFLAVPSIFRDTSLVSELNYHFIIYLLKLKTSTLCWNAFLWKFPICSFHIVSSPGGFWLLNFLSKSRLNINLSKGENPFSSFRTVCYITVIFSIFSYRVLYVFTWMI